MARNPVRLYLIGSNVVSAISSDLSSITTYYQSKERVKNYLLNDFTPVSVASLFSVLKQCEIERVLEPTRMECAFIEVLCNPELLKEKSICKKFQNVSICRVAVLIAVGIDEREVEGLSL